MWYLRLSFMAVIYFELNYVCSRYPVASFSMKFLPHFQYRLTDNTHTRVCVNAKKKSENEHSFLLRRPKWTVWGGMYVCTFMSLHIYWLLNAYGTVVTL